MGHKDSKTVTTNCTDEQLTALLFYLDEKFAVFALLQTS